MKFTKDYINKTWAKTLKDMGAWYLTKCKAIKKFALDDNDPYKSKEVDAVIINYYSSSYIVYYDNETFKIERDTLWTWKKRNKKSSIDKLINKHTDNKWLVNVLEPIHLQEQKNMQERHKEAIKNVRKER